MRSHMRHVASVALIMLLAAAVAVRTLAQEAKPRGFPTHGISFEPPPSSIWAEAPREKDETVMDWIRAGARGDAEWKISVEGAKSAFAKLDEAAPQLARLEDCVVEEKPAMLDGVEARRIRGNGKQPGWNVRDGFVCVHKGYLYLLLNSAKGEAGVGNELDSVQKSWRWIDIEPPSKHLALAKKPVSIFQGRATIQLPAIARIVTEELTTRTFHTGIPNMARGGPDFTLFAQTLPNARAESIAELQTRFGDSLVAKRLVPKAPAWNSLKGSTPRAISDACEMMLPGMEDRGTVIWAVIAFDQAELVLINFTIPKSVTPDEVKAYRALAEEVVSSVALAKQTRTGE